MRSLLHASFSHTAHCFHFPVDIYIIYMMFSDCYIHVHVSVAIPPPTTPHTLKVIRSLKHAMQPAVTGATVSFDLPPGYHARLAPSVVPPIFIGERTIVYALLESSEETAASGGMATMTLQGKLQGETVKHTLEVELRTLSKSGEFPLSLPTIHHLTGKAFIRDLLLNEESPGGRPVKEEVVKLSCECSVISKHTAFIAIDEEQKEPVKGSLQTWDVVARPPMEEFGFVSLSACSVSRSHRSTRAPRSDGLESMLCDLSLSE